MKHKASILTLSLYLVVLFSGCIDKSAYLPPESPTSENGGDEFKDMEIDENFNFTTSEQVPFRAEIKDANGKAFHQLILFVFTDHPDNGGKLIEYMGMNGKTTIESTINLSLATDSVYLASNYGGIGDIKIPISNAGIVYSYVSETNSKSVLKSAGIATEAIISTYFDTGIEEWKVKGDKGANALLHSSHELCPISEGINGPDDNFLWGFDTQRGMRIFEAPEKYHTNIYGKFLRYDYYIGNTEGIYSTAANLPDINITDGNQYLSVDLSTSFPHRVNGGWQTLYIKLDETASNGTGWRIDEMSRYGSMNGSKALGRNTPTKEEVIQILSNVKGILIAPELQVGSYDKNGPEFVCIDNIEIVESLESSEIIEQEPELNNDRDNDGVEDDVDGYPDDTNKAWISNVPGENTFGTLAYEDLWPGVGDYDFNDMVLAYNFKHIKNASGLITQIDISLQLKAIGGSIRNGFGIEFDISPNQVASVVSDLGADAALLSNIGTNGVEQNQDKAVVIVFTDAYKVLKHSGSGTGVNTDNQQDYVEPKLINISVKLTEGVSLQELGYAPNNAFIFKSENRGHEIHLPGMPPTSLADRALFGTQNDATIFSAGYYYRTRNGMPWGMNIPVEFAYPMERAPIDQAYLTFAKWAQSGGFNYMDWYVDKSGYRNSSKLYKKFND